MKQRGPFLKANPLCACHPRLTQAGIKCSPNARDVHHMRGKLGALRCDERYWLPVCRAAHTWIDANREAARQLGWLCQTGEFNTIPA